MKPGANSGRELRSWHRLGPGHMLLEAKLHMQRLFPRAAHNVEWVWPRYPNCGQDAATFETGPRVSRDRCARRSPHNRRHAASDSHSARPGPFLRNVRRSIRTYLTDHHPMGRQRGDGPGSVAVDTTVCRPVVPEPQTTASKMSDARVCGH